MRSGSKTFPGIYTRLDDFKVLDWVYRAAFKNLYLNLPFLIQDQPSVLQPKETESWF